MNLMKANPWVVCIWIIVMLGSFCFWNCYHREDPASADVNWRGCKDHFGNAVDMFMIYKLPHNHSSSSPTTRNGTGYMFLTPESADRVYVPNTENIYHDLYSPTASESGWVMSDIGIDDSSSFPGQTLHTFYTDPVYRKSVAYIMYNDEFPNGSKTLAEGHTKGVVVLGSEGGFWLVHSVPEYPPFPEDGYSYPSSGHVFGQSMLCLSLSEDQADIIGRQLIYNNPYIYSSHMPDELKSNFVSLKMVMDGEKPKTSPFYRMAKITSSAGATVISFAKYKKFNGDLYSKLVAPALQTALQVESWRNGVKPVPSTCNQKYPVENIESISAAAADLVFTTHHDHSKWAVATEPDEHYVCIGDINRMETQFNRSGGTVCVKRLSIWQRYHNLVHSTERCPSTI
ncbi:deoxyribonuclease II [Oratosquilla oratoria]|uniref:deoxyribonuclease II n=1 Tax=Oratosquilla oratoria TaxID=337810 RepID=UPI003F75B922